MLRVVGYACLTCALLVSGCQTGPATVDTRLQAEAEATAIIQQAQATALMIQAQAQATAMVAQAAAILEAAQSTGSQPTAPQPTQVGLAQATPASTESTTELIPLVTASQPVSQTVEIHSVTFAADTGFIMVNYLAPPHISANFYQGTVSVVNEATEDRYAEVAVVPVIGPLISRPPDPGQIGFIMLVNGAPGLKAGDMVTVQMGEYFFEHILVQ